MSLKENERRLIQLVEQQRDSDCLELLDQARDEARELLHAAHRRSREHLHSAAATERTRVRAQVGAARAELETRRRQHRQRLGFALLEVARERLPRLLAERWADPDGRAGWIRQAAEQALLRLPKGVWTIHHPPDLPAADREQLAGILGDLPQAPDWHADASLDSGLIIENEGVRLDACTAGLLEDERAIEARLLALIDLENLE